MRHKHRASKAITISGRQQRNSLQALMPRPRRRDVRRAFCAAIEFHSYFCNSVVGLGCAFLAFALLTTCVALVQATSVAESARYLLRTTASSWRLMLRPRSSEVSIL